MSRKSLVLNSQLENVYLRDIVSRYGLHNGENIGDFLDVLASGLSTLVNPHKLANAFQSLKNASIAPHTIASSIKHLEEAFLICCAGRYDVKGKNTSTLRSRSISKMSASGMHDCISSKSK